MMAMKIAPPKSISLNEILPKEPTLLMGAGPVPIPADVARANSVVISHLGETMNCLVDRIRAMSQYVFQTQSTKILGIAGPSSAAMEMAITSLLWEGRKALVLKQGTFSARFSELARLVGAEVTELTIEGVSCFRAADVKAVLENKDFDVLTIVQGETSCGVKNTELPEIVKVAREYGVRTIVDGVCTLSTMPLLMDEWGIDVVLTGGQKGLSAVPGISLIAFSEETFKFISERETNMPHWCLDPRRGWRFWGLHEYHYTAPVAAVLALHEALRLICEETLEIRWHRHEFSSRTLQLCLETMGLELFAPSECRLNSVVAIKHPETIDTRVFLKHMSQSYHVEIAGAFGLSIVRVGQMGEQCRSTNVRRTLEAIGGTYEHYGMEVKLRRALEEFDRITLAQEVMFQANLPVIG